MKKTLAFALAVLLIISTAACSSAPASTPTPSAKGASQKLVVAHKGDPGGLFAQTIANSTFNGPLDYLLYDPLVFYDNDSNSFKPCIAEKWEQVDSTHMKFYLRKDVYAHDGNQIKASDVIYTLKTGQESGKVASYYDRFDLKECKVVDDYTVIVATKTPDPYLFYTLSGNALGIVSEAAVKAGGGPDAQQTKPTAGSGAYKFVSWERGLKIVLARNDRYWGGKPYFDTIEVRIITDISARMMNLESGDVDVVLDPDVTQAKALLGNNKFKVDNIKTIASNMFLMNCSKAPFNDVKVRQAMALALDYKSDVEVAMKGFGYVTDSIFANAHPAYAAPDGSYTNYYHYDLAAAKKLMAESKYPNGFTFTLKYTETAVYPALAQLMQNQLAQIGIKVVLAPTASTVFYTDAAAGNFDMYLAAPSFADPFSYLNFFDGRVGFQKANGGCGWQGPEELNTLIDKAKVNMDEASRKEMLKKIQAIINTNVPALVLGSQNRVLVAKADVQGIKYQVNGDIILSRAGRK